MRRTILTASHVYPPSGDRVARRAFDKHPPANIAQLAPLLTRLGAEVDEPRVTARVNHGRWMADCPFCPSAQVCDPADPWFLCAGADGCANHPVAGAYVPIDFPDDADRATVEELLGTRIRQATVNWEGEPPEQLLAENELLADEAKP